MVNVSAYQQLRSFCDEKNVTLIAVSKLKPVEDIMALYNLGHRDFGENYVQEMLSKAGELPQDIRWHFIGHLQRNKVKQILPIAHLIHGVDSERLLTEVNKEAGKKGQPARVLLQVHIAQEETKFGLDESELTALMQKVQAGQFPHTLICGLMGMASFSSDQDLLAKEFSLLQRLFQQHQSETFKIMSAGMSSDYALAVAHGSNHIRIGSTLFGARG